MTKPKIFISSSTEGIPIARALAQHVSQFAESTLWTDELFRPAQTTFESLAEVADRSDFAVFVLTPDDVTQSRGQTFNTPRDNLIFELGFLAGRIGTSRTLVLAAGNPPRVKIPSDLAGIVYVPLQIDPEHIEVSESDPAVRNAAKLVQKAINDTQPRQASDNFDDFYSCFISYSWNDQSFATRLHGDLQSVGVRCWLDVKDMMVAEPIYEQIDRAIQVHDKVLLVLSQSSITSPWVDVEIRKAVELENARKQTILFPITVDDAVFQVRESSSLDTIKQKANTADFRNWSDDQLYHKAFSRLIRDLAVSASVESGARG